MILSDRLESIIELVPEGLVCADIGCDHGLISIELVSRNIAPFVYGMDLREGPLERARENILEGKELSGARKMLIAAALTYVAAAASAVLQLMRLLLLNGKRSRR